MEIIIYRVTIQNRSLPFSSTYSYSFTDREPINARRSAHEWADSLTQFFDAGIKFGIFKYTYRMAEAYPLTITIELITDTDGEETEHGCIYGADEQELIDTWELEFLQLSFQFHNDNNNLQYVLSFFIC
jgi:hypothetical protein